MKKKSLCVWFFIAEAKIPEVTKQEKKLWGSWFQSMIGWLVHYIQACSQAEL